MKSQWSATVSDWQGVDDDPTTGSDNLVKSGGIANSINNLEQRIGEKLTDLEHKTGTHITGTWAKYTKVADVDIPIGTTFKNNGGEKLGLSSDSTRAGATKTLNDNETWISTYAVKSIWCETNVHEGNVDVNIVGSLDFSKDISDINANISNLSDSIKNLQVTRTNGKLPNFYQSKQVNHISSGANLNNYKDANVLFSLAGVANNPDSLHNWMIVNSVAPWQDGNRYYCLQYAYRVDDVSVQYVRIYESNSNIFGDWKTLDVGSDLRVDIDNLKVSLKEVTDELSALNDMTNEVPNGNNLFDGKIKGVGFINDDGSINSNT